MKVKISGILATVFVLRLAATPWFAFIAKEFDGKKCTGLKRIFEFTALPLVLIP
jgi:hypothetical protein